MSLFTVGALAVIRYAKLHGTNMRSSMAPSSPALRHCWRGAPTKVAAIAFANKIGRMPWAMMTRGERYK